MRLLSEVFYARFLDAYITGLEVHEERLKSQGKDACPLTETAMKLAKDALDDGVFAARLALEQNVETATTEGEEAFQMMVKRCVSIVLRERMY